MLGHANGGAIKFIKEFVLYIKKVYWDSSLFKYSDFQAFYPSSIKRLRLLKEIVKSEKLNSEFIFRSKYRAGVSSENNKFNSQKEFYENIYNNLVYFCLRGTGNFPVRFYETLAIGRIPVLINTDCKLPLEHLIDWNKHSIITTEKEMINDIIRFHASKSNEEIIAIQNNNRNLWLNYLTPESYFKQILESKKTNWNMFVSLIICTYQRKDALLRLLTSVQKQSLYPNEILIIDGSLDNETEIAIKELVYQKLRFYKVDDNNRGLTKQRNFGVDQLNTDCEVVCFLDDDTLLHEDYFKNIKERFEAEQSITGIGGLATNENRWKPITDSFKYHSKRYKIIDGYYVKEGFRNVVRNYLGLGANQLPGVMPAFRTAIRMVIR